MRNVRNFAPYENFLLYIRGKLNYNQFLSESTHNFLDHPSHQEVSPWSQTVLHNVSSVHSTTRNCKISYSAPTASEHVDQ